MTGKFKKLATSFQLQVFWNDDASVAKNAVFAGCSNLSALTYSSLAYVQKFITHRTFILSVSINNRWKAETMIYICHVYAQT
jgi:hypothetical protein